MKTLAFVFGICIGTVGAVGVLAPSSLIWIAKQFVSAGAVGFYLIAAARVTFGFILISAASASRMPMPLRVLGYVIVLLGAATALAGSVAIGRAQDVIEWWVHLGSGVVRITGVPVLALGGFVAYVCAPTRRAA